MSWISLIIKDVPQLCLSTTWPRRSAGYNLPLQFRTQKQLLYQSGFHVQNCNAFVVNKLPCVAKLHRIITEERPKVKKFEHIYYAKRNK